jgi:hypothetical protein
MQNPDYAKAYAELEAEPHHPLFLIVHSQIIGGDLSLPCIGGLAAKQAQKHLAVADETASIINPLLFHERTDWPLVVDGFSQFLDCTGEHDRGHLHAATLADLTLIFYEKRHSRRRSTACSRVAISIVSP